MSALNNNYTITHDWKGSKYVGITLDWYYGGRKLYLSMSGYIGEAVIRFGHKIPTKRQDSPYPSAPVDYGKKTQYDKAPDDIPLLDDKVKKYIQCVNGTLVYIGRYFESTLTTPLSAIAFQKSKPTIENMKRAKTILNYVSTQDKAILTYTSSDMLLAAHSDAGYLKNTNSRSRAGGHFFLSENVEHPANNGAILAIAQIIKNVMASAAEAKIGALYIIAR